MREVAILGALAAGAVIFVVGISIACMQHCAKQGAIERDAATLRVPASAPTGAGPLFVKTGVYVDRISQVTFKEASWSVDLYVWFDWSGDADASPGRRLNLINGAVDAIELVREHHDGVRHYEQYKVRATITKVFDISRFPLDDHLLAIQFEDRERRQEELVFVADTEGSATSSRARMPGYEVYRTRALVKPHAYKTSRGDPRLAPGKYATHSQFVYGISIARPGWGLFLKLFLGLYIPVAVSMLVFFIKPTDIDARFGLSLGALFAVMANQYVITQSLPEVTNMSLADFINGLGILTILLTLAQSTASLYLVHRGEEAVSVRFDRVAFVVFATSFFVVNLAMPLAARL